MAEDLVELLTAQLRLTRLELSRDARLLGTRLARMALFVPLILLGYAFLMGAAVFGLEPHVPGGRIGALLLVGAVNLGVGIVGCLLAARRLEGVRLLDQSRGELERSVERVTSAARHAEPTSAARHAGTTAEARQTGSPLSPQDP